MMRWAAVLLMGVGCTQVDPCTAIECGRGVCVINAGAPACLCERGFEGIDLRCFPVSACGAQRPAADGGCSDEPRWDCSRQTISNAQDPAEPNDCPAQARALAIDGSAIGAFGVEGDIDWYFVEGAPNTVVTLAAQGAPMTMASFNADGFTQRGPRERTEPFSIGTRGLFIAVKAQEPGPYRLTLVSVGQDDRTDEFFDAPEVAALSSVEGTLDFPADVDVVALRMAPGSSAEVALLMESGSGVCDVTDASGRWLHSFTQHAVVWSEGGGPLFLSVRRAANSVTPARWLLEIVSAGLDDAPDHPDFAVQAGVPGVQRFERPNDLDVFRIERRPGHVYEVNCSAANGGCDIVVLNRWNQRFSQRSQLLRFRVPNEGPVFLGFSGHAPSSFFWSLDDLGVDDHGDELGTATALSQGIPMRGNIDFDGDLDAFTVSYPKGTSLRFNLAPDTRLQNGLGIVQGVLVVDDDPELLLVSGHEGPYDIAVVSLGIDPGGSDGMPISVQLPFIVDGGIDYEGDQDAWVFPAIADHVYRASVSPEAQLSMNQDGVRHGWGRGSAQLVAATNGTVSVSVTGYQEGPYQLQLSDIGVDDHPDQMPAPLLVGVPTAGLFDSGNDLELFSATLVPGRFYEARCAQPECLVSQGQGFQVRLGSLCVQPMAAQTPFAVTSNYSSRDFVSSRWSLELVDLGDDDHLSSPLQATPVPFDSSTSAMLSCHADSDTFSWSAGPRQITTLRASCTGCSATVMSRWRQEATQVDGGLVLTVPPSTTRITATFATTQPTALTFTVGDGGFDDQGDTLSTATAATPGTATTGELQYDGDADVFYFDLPAGGHLFELTGADVQAELWLATGPLFTLDTSSMQFVAPTAGRYFVLLKGRGAYRLVVQ